MANESVFRNGIVIKNGAQNGYILTSDSNGLASWTSSSFITTISSTPSLSQVLTTGNSTGANNIILTNGQSLISSTTNSSLRFNVSNANSVELTTDNAAYATGSAWFYGQQNNGSQISYQITTSEAIGLGVYESNLSPELFTAKEIVISDNTTSNSQSGLINKRAVLIGTRNSTINSGLTNSVVIGGVGLLATQSNTVVLGNIVDINNEYTLPSVDGSDGQVLTTNGLGSVTWQTSSSSGITGSGTAGYLPKFTGTYSIGNSGFADDGSIGGYISGGLTLSVAFTSTQALFRDGSITSPSISFQNDTDTGFYRNVNNQITVMSGGNTSSIFTDKGINLDSEITNNTVYGIASASNPSEAVRYSQLQLTESYLPKSGYVEGASFSGSPLTYTVSFATQFPDDNTYSISIIGEDSRAWSVSNVTKTQFTIESNSSTSLTGRVRWMAQKYNNV